MQTTQHNNSTTSNRSNNYIYHSLGNIDPDSQDQYNFFGVIIDAAYPYKTSNGKYICTIKVVDQTIHHKGESSSPLFANVVIYAKRFEDLPIIRRVGDIMRVHRANVKFFNDMRQFYVNLQYNSSWCLFHQNQDKDDDDFDDNDSDENQNGEDQEMLDQDQLKEKQLERQEKRRYKPYKFSGRSYTFDINHEKIIMDNIRTWGQNYFANNYVITKDMYMLLKDCKTKMSNDESQEFDLLCKILKIFEKDENNLEIRIKDLSQEMWFMSVPRFKFQSLKQGEVIRIRCVEVNLTSKRNVIQTKNNTNILRFHPSSRIATELSKVIEDETDMDKVLGDEASDIVMNAVVLTEITDSSLARGQMFKLTDLFLNFDQIPENLRERNAFRVRFYCLRIDPIDHREVVQAYCPECSETYSCETLEKEGKGKCKSCKVECKLIYKMQMLVKDSSSQMNKNFYRILLYSFDEDRGNDFFSNVRPCNLYKNADALETIEKQIKAMTKFNVWIDAIIERQGAFFLIRDTKITQVIN
ncbi:alpha telomere binding protein [Stylonychia lemnae]|uniref:Alpha telomere binding protein n=1 Tax=Stylonychia lemnae TaxID=5949 RepID=A0A078A1P9_STYLE|nr:alpha telomere binding protein [Stylonychia lemnae]|eukprot:CDW75388.1 alpha telomere binding protein [Stylonychia lemnae]